MEMGEAAVPDERLELWLARCRALAEGALEGIEDASKVLAALAEGDRHLMERARRHLLAAQTASPGNRTLTQMLSLWRRAFELGTWDWAE
jgi:hypothetical protein